MGLYKIEYKNYETKKVDGFQKFAHMTAGEQTTDVGKNVNMIGNSIVSIVVMLSHIV
jgi:hypothetical protein